MNRILPVMALTSSVILASGENKTTIKEDTRPNIIFVFVDDMGYGDPSSFGNTKIQTPNMDRIAKEGIKFTNFYVASPICSPSRVGVTTGQYPSRHRITSYLAGSQANASRGMVNYLDPKVPTIAKTLKQSGYATAHFGKWHMGGGRDVGDAPWPTAYGFDEALTTFEGLGDRLLIKGQGLSERNAKLGQGKITWVEPYDNTTVMVDRTLDFIKRQGSKPFYIHLWTDDVHEPYHPRPEYKELFKSVASNPDEQAFLANLYQLDLEIGRLLKGLDALGVADKTLIMIAGDNGPTDGRQYYQKKYSSPPGSAGPFRGRKRSLYEGGIRECFMARWPGHIPAGVTNTTTILHSIDFFPTFCRLAGVKLPDVAFDGLEMSDALLGKAQQRSKPIFWEFNDAKPPNPRFASPCMAMRDGPWKLLMDGDGSKMELYDLIKDQAETTNVAKQNPEIAATMARQLLEWKSTLPKPLQCSRQGVTGSHQTPAVQKAAD